jgi:hypothetical protein
MKRIRQATDWVTSHKLVSGTIAAAGITSFVLVFLGGTGSNASVPEPTPAAATSPTNPLVGNQGNDQPVLDTVEDWRDLVDAVNRDDLQWYRDCLKGRIEVTWEQAERYAQLVDEGHDLRFILVSNSSISDETARQRLKDQGFDDVDDLKVVRVPGFRNTRGLPSDRCNPFGDERSQVRLSLAVPKDVNDLSKGFHEDRGVLAMCSNPWDLFPPVEITTTTTTTSTTTTTTPKRGKDHRKSPVSDLPNDACEACRPNTSEPVRETTATTTDPNPDGGAGPSDSGEGATNTTSPPTTTQPPATAPPGPPNSGTVPSR